MPRDISELDQDAHRLGVSWRKAMNYWASFSAQYHEVKDRLDQGEFGPEWTASRWIMVKAHMNERQIIRLLHVHQHALAAEERDRIEQEHQDLERERQRQAEERRQAAQAEREAQRREREAREAHQAAQRAEREAERQRAAQEQEAGRQAHAERQVRIEQETEAGRLRRAGIEERLIPLLLAAQAAVAGLSRMLPADASPADQRQRWIGYGTAMLALKMAVGNDNQRFGRLLVHGLDREDDTFRTAAMWVAAPEHASVLESSPERCSFTHPNDVKRWIKRQIALRDGTAQPAVRRQGQAPRPKHDKVVAWLWRFIRDGGDIETVDREWLKGELGVSNQPIKTGFADVQAVMADRAAERLARTADDKPFTAAEFGVVLHGADPECADAHARGETFALLVSRRDLLAPTDQPTLDGHVTPNGQGPHPLH
jgi:hypothetical protein